MTMNFGLDDTHLSILRKPLAEYLPPGARVVVFGSRTMRTHKPRSDLDLQKKLP